MSRRFPLRGAALAALTLTGALTAAGAAGAATFIEAWTTSASGAMSATLGDNGLGVAGSSAAPGAGSSTHVYDATTNMFTDTYDFVLPTGSAGASVITTLSGQSSNDLTFSGITFNDAAGTTTAGGGVAVAHVSFQDIAAGGAQRLVITGMGGASAVYGGTVSFLPSGLETLQNGIPEPATWAMLLMGFGGIGGLLRQQRRRQTVPSVQTA